MEKPMKREGGEEGIVRNRVELKYLLGPEEARRLTSRLGPAFRRPGFRAERGWVTTVYLDRPDGELARTALRRPSESVKLRLREYFTPDELPLWPWVWIEIKERLGVASRKSRLRLPNRWVGPFLRGEPLEERWILEAPPGDSDPGALSQAVRRFREVARGPVTAVGAVRYRRLALEGGTPRTRLTLDEEITYHLDPLNLGEGGGSIDRDSLGAPTVGEDGAILEVKHPDAGPSRWCLSAVGGRRPVEYSKFRTLAALALSETLAAGEGPGRNGYLRRRP
jgi:hypothetical protein